MKQELVRMTSMDNLEMVGMLYEPEERNHNTCTWIMW